MSVPTTSIPSTSLPENRMPTSDATTQLAALRVEAEASRGGYDRDLFRHWIDADRDGVTRGERYSSQKLSARL